MSDPRNFRELNIDPKNVTFVCMKSWDLVNRDVSLRHLMFHCWDDDSNLAQTADSNLRNFGCKLAVTLGIDL